MSHLRLPLLLTLLLATPSLQAQVDSPTWADPSLEEALQSAQLVVFARVKKVGKRGAAYLVQQTYKGPTRDGDQVDVEGLPEDLQQLLEE